MCISCDLRQLFPAAPRAGVHGTPHRAEASAETKWSSHSPEVSRVQEVDFYYRSKWQNLLWSVANVHMDRVPTGAREPVQSPLLSVLLTTVTGHLKSGIPWWWSFQLVPTWILIWLKALISIFLWIGSERALVSWSNRGYNLSLGETGRHPPLGLMSKPPWELLRWYELPWGIAYLTQEGKEPFTVRQE